MLYAFARRLTKNQASEAGDHTCSPQRKLWVSRREEMIEPAKRAT